LDNPEGEGEEETDLPLLQKIAIVIVALGE